MSADNELAIAEFTDCIVVKMQFASWFWDEECQTSEDNIREAFAGAKEFATMDEAEEYAFKEEMSSYYEYGVSIQKYDYALKVE